MGVKAELKAARARMQAGNPAEAFAMIQQILDSASPDLKDAQTLYAVLVTAGLAGLASQDLTKAEHSFRRAAESIPDAPQVQQSVVHARHGASHLRRVTPPEPAEFGLSSNAPGGEYYREGKISLFQSSRWYCCVFGGTPSKPKRHQRTYLLLGSMPPFSLLFGLEPCWACLKR